MRYPTLPLATTRRITKERLAGSDPEFDDHVKWIGSGNDADLDRIAVLAKETDAAIADHSGSDRGSVEGRFAVQLHDCLHELPIFVLDDPDFWAYLGVRYFWKLVEWRESKTFESGESAKYMKYVDGKHVTECVLTRMFLRGRICVAGGAPALSHQLTSATDLWRSHIIRVSTSYAPALATSILEAQAREPMNTDKLRAFARRINRALVVESVE